MFHATNFVAPPTRRAATVVTVHDLTYLRYPEMVTAASARYRDLVPRALRRGAVVCTPTAAVAAEVAAEYGLPPTAWSSPPRRRPSWRQGHPTRPGLAGHPRPPARYLLFVGNREPRKNLAGLLTAYRHLPAGVGVGNGPAAGEGAGEDHRAALVLVGPRAGARPWTPPASRPSGPPRLPPARTT